MRRNLLIGLVVLVAALVVPALALGYSGPSRQGDAAAPSAHDADAPGSPRPWVGVALVNLNGVIAERLGVEATEGVAVARVLPDSPAEAAGVLQGDVVLGVAGQPVATVKGVVEAVRGSEPGDTVTFLVLRGADEIEMDIVTGERPQPQPLGLRKAPAFMRMLAPMAGNLMRADITLADADGNPVNMTFIAGAVTAIGEGSLTVAPRDGGEPLDLAIEDGTIVHAPGCQSGDGAGLAVDDEVVVALKDGDLVGVMGMPPHPARAAAPGGHFSLPQMRGGLMGAPPMGSKPGLRLGQQGWQRFGTPGTGAMPAPDMERLLQWMTPRQGQELREGIERLQRRLGQLQRPDRGTPMGEPQPAEGSVTT